MKRIVITLLALGVLSGCRPAQNNGQSAASTPQILRYPLNVRPTTYDPAILQDVDTSTVHTQVFSGLVAWNEKNELIPDIAEKWETSNGGKTYTFKLKDNVYFHAPFKRKVTAQDFVYSLTRTLKSKASSTAETYLGDIVGAAEARSGKTEAVAGLRAIDDRTLQIDINAPRPYFISKLTYPCAYVVCKEALEKNGGRFDEKQMIGTGPFALKEVSTLKLILAANPDYYGPKPVLASIERPIMTETTSRQNAYEGGLVDLTDVRLGDLDRIRKEFGDQVHDFDRANTWYVAFNQKAFSPFKNRKVRRAFAMAINKDELIKIALKGTGKRAEGVVPPGVFGHDPAFKGIAFDPAGARELLAEAGYPDGAGFPPLTLSFSQGYKEVEDTVLMMRDDLKKNLNLSVDVQKIEWSQFLTLRDQGKLAMFYVSWFADYLDAQNFLSTLLHSRSRENQIGYGSPDFDRLCDQADVEQDAARRKAFYGQAERIVVDDAAWICVAHTRSLELIRPRVRGLRDGLMGHLPHVMTRIEGR